MIKEVVLAQKIVRLHAAAGRPARPASGGAAPNSQPAGAETLGQTQTCWGQTPRSRVETIRPDSPSVEQMLHTCMYIDRGHAMAGARPTLNSTNLVR
jgi:hypothetical protein